VATLVYLHGVGGVRPGWAEPLVRDCWVRGFAPRIIAVNYADLLSVPVVDDVAESAGADVVRDRADGAGLSPNRLITDGQRRKYRARQADLVSTLGAVGAEVSDGTPWTAALAQPAQILRMPGGRWWGLDQAHRYLREECVRGRIRDRVASVLWDVSEIEDEPVVVIGHSLGALVALDVISDPGVGGDAGCVAPDLLITIGAPLGHSDIVQHLSGRSMPVGDLGAWVNVVHRLDPVQGGLGAAARFPEAVDVYLPVKSPLSSFRAAGENLRKALTAHLDSTYLTSSVVQAAVAWGLSESVTRGRVPSER
jgi:hypothetical protein